jgi:hypothetical protein
MAAPNEELLSKTGSLNASDSGSVKDDEYQSAKRLHMTVRIIITVVVTFCVMVVSLCCGTTVRLQICDCSFVFSPMTLTLISMASRILSPLLHLLFKRTRESHPWSWALCRREVYWDSTSPFLLV